jgi:phage terminase small subunit
MAELTDKQKAFVEEYLIDLNATQAAIRAGYSEKTARQVGNENLTKPDVADAIAAAQAERSQRTEVSADRVLLELARISFSDAMRHYVIDEEGNVQLAEGAPEGATAAVSSIKRKSRTVTNKQGDTETFVETEIRLWDKNTAIANAGKHLGMFVDRHEVTGKDGEALFKSFLGVDTDAV